jgi:hypothetical protein
VQYVVLGVAAVIASAVGYFFSIIAAFTSIMAFMALLIGVLNPSTFEKVHHYAHPRPMIERIVPPTNPDTPANPEPRHARVALGTNEATPAKAPSGQDKSTKETHAAPIARTDAENPKPERKIRHERLVDFHQLKVPARQRQNNFQEYGYGMASGYAEGYHPGLDAQR